jgi:curli biogenesis system outer membrane secretion channel CsgG
MALLSRRYVLLGASGLLGATGLGGASALAAATGPRGPKKRVFVASVGSLASFDAAYGGSAGDPLAAQFATILSQSREFDVVDRADLASLQAEQQLNAAHGSVAAMAQQDATILGAQLIVEAYITTFETSTTNGLNIGLAGTNLGGALGGQVTKGDLGMDIRITDTTTALLLGSTHIDETISAKSATAAVTGPTTTVTQQNANNTVLGQATRAAFAKAAVFVSQKAAATTWTGLVADVDGNEVYVNIGQTGNVAVGDLFDITRVGRRITDPASGQLLGVTETPVGRIQITSVQAQFSVGAPPSGAIAAQKGDIARYVPPGA